jgi:hypothetical protein
MKSKFLIGIKYLSQLGPRPLALYAVYKFGLLTGHYKRLTPISDNRDSNIELPNIVPLFSLPNRYQLSQTLGEEGRSTLLKEADEIVNGNVRIFGKPVFLQFTFAKPLSHWTEYETNKTPIPDSQFPIPDIKFLWEPARFAFAFTLGRAYHLSPQLTRPARGQLLRSGCRCRKPSFNLRSWRELPAAAHDAVDDEGNAAINQGVAIAIRDSEGVGAWSHAGIGLHEIIVISTRHADPLPI